MQPEQQQRIMGYFIEEAKDHLNTIEQGLLNLQSTLDDAEMVNELFRAAHSVKGGAAMLGLNSIQHVSHRLEDYFKILKESPVKVDQKLESLFLQVFDALQELVGQLQGPFGLTEDAANATVAAVEPTFGELEQHLHSLAGSATAVSVAPKPAPIAESVSPPSVSLSPELSFFQNDVPAQLREMLQLFKQSEAEPTSRQRLQAICHALIAAGERFNLLDWCHLLETARQAIAHADNAYRVLAPVVIKDIKQAQDLVLAGRGSEINPCAQLLKLVPLPTPDRGMGEPGENNFADFLVSADRTADSIDAPIAAQATAASDDFLFAGIDNRRTTDSFDLTDEFVGSGESVLDQNGPEVGMAELNSLADLFEGEMPELGSTWQQEEMLDGAPDDFAILSGDPFGQDAANDFSDLLFDEGEPFSTTSSGTATNDDLSDLFGDDLLEDDEPDSAAVTASSNVNQHSADEDLDDLLALSEVADRDGFDHDRLDDAVFNGIDGIDAIASASDTAGNSDFQNTFDDLGFEDLGLDTASGSDPLADMGFASDPTTEPSGALGNLGALFADMDETDLKLGVEKLGVEKLGVEAQTGGSDDLFAADLQALENIADINRSEGTLHEEALTSAGGQSFGNVLDDPWEDSGAIGMAPEDSSNRSDPASLASLTDSSLTDDLSAFIMPTDLSGMDDFFGEAIPTESLEALSDQDEPDFSSLLDFSGSAPGRTATEPAAREVLLDEELTDDDFAPLGEQTHGALTDEFLTDDLLTDASFDLSAAFSAAESDAPSVEPQGDFADLDWLTETPAPDTAVGSIPEGNALIDNLSQDNLLQDDAFADLGDVWNGADLDPGTEPQGAETPPSGEATADFSFDLEGFDQDLESDGDQERALSFGDQNDEFNLADHFMSADVAEVPVAESQAESQPDLDDLFGSDALAFGEQEPSVPFAGESDLDFGDRFFESTHAEDSLEDTSLEDTSLDSVGTASSAAMDLDLDVETSDLSDLDDLLNISAATAVTDGGILNNFDLLEVDSSPLPQSGSAGAASTDFDDLDDLLRTEATDTVVQFADLDDLLEESPAATNDFDDLDNLLQGSDSNATDTFSDLDQLLNGSEAAAGDDADDDFADLDNLLAGGAIAAGSVAAVGAANALFNQPSAEADSLADDFADLEAMLQGDTDASVGDQTAAVNHDADFDELDNLLRDAEEKMGGAPSVKANRGMATQNRRPSRPGRVFSEQTMRVPVKHLDNLSNLVGELVVNRNSLEEDQERLRQSLDNLLYQVQQLSDVGQRMQDLYERSLLESSLLASRQNQRHGGLHGTSIFSRDHGTVTQATNSTGIEYDPLEMDRFTGFHSLSQEMIELIVRVRESSSDIEFIVDETDQVTRMFRQVTTQLQEGLTRSRMVPFAQTADRLPRAVRDIAMKFGKQAELNIEGRETLIDKMILEQLYDPMTHLVNNAITHGIESPEVRRRAGKAPAGRITIRAFHQGNQTIISVSDDGAGIDIDRVKTKALEKGLITPAESRSMSRLDVYDLLFHAGFSTKDQADDFSGRGVGMDVVRTSLSEIRGVINTDSTQGKGTTFTIRLPLTLSISKALCCISDRARIAFPMDGVEDMLDVPKERIQTNAAGQACIPWRDSLLPLRPLNDLLSYSRHLSRGNVYGGHQEDDIVSIVVLRSAGNFLALQVDQVLGEQEIVIKQLEGPIPKPVGVAGATVLGDGRIMPIADVLELIDLSMGRIRKDVGGSLWEQGGAVVAQEAPIAKTEPTVLIVDDSITVRELLSMTFNKVGYRVEQARDGQEAWEKLRSGLPCDIVFCDIEMPRMDGLELLSRIQKDSNLSHLPIAMLTSRGADRHRQMAASLGASGYFTKPYLEEALLDAAQRMLKGERLLSSNA